MGVDHVKTGIYIVQLSHLENRTKFHCSNHNKLQSYFLGPNLNLACVTFIMFTLHMISFTQYLHFIICILFVYPVDNSMQDSWMNA